MSGWSLFEKRDVESLSRVVGARSLDGQKVRAKLSINFPRALAQSEADSILMQYARAFAAMVETELCDGHLPFDVITAHERITERVQAVPRHRVRVYDLQLLKKGSNSSQSMAAVSLSAAPAAEASSPQGSPRAASGRIPIAPRSSASKLPTVRAPEARAPAVPMPAVVSTTPPARNNLTITLMPEAESTPAPRMVSGFAPNPRIVRSASRFELALDACADPSDGALLGQCLAGAVRSAAASVLFVALEATHDRLDDPLTLLDGNADPELRRAIVAEGCVCVCYLLYQALYHAAVPQGIAIQVVQTACVYALAGRAMPVSEISRYLATESPAEEFSARFCAMLGAAEGSDLQQRVDGVLDTVRTDVRLCAEQIRRRDATSSNANG